MDAADIALHTMAFTLHAVALLFVSGAETARHKGDSAAARTGMVIALTLAALAFVCQGIA